MDVSFFIDGFYVGNHPLSAPIPVLPGFHEVSYIPPEIQHEKLYCKQVHLYLKKYGNY